MKEIILVIFSLLSLSCSSQKSSINNTAKSPDEIAVTKIGLNFESIKNNSHTLVLYRTTDKNNFPTKHLRFFIYDFKKEEIIYEEEANNAVIAWTNDLQLELHIYPGNVIEGQSQEDYKYIITPASGDKRKKGKVNLITK